MLKCHILFIGISGTIYHVNIKIWPSKFCFQISIFYIQYETKTKSCIKILRHGSPQIDQRNIHVHVLKQTSAIISKISMLKRIFVKNEDNHWLSNDIQYIL